MTLLASGRALDLLDRALAYTRGCLPTAVGVDLSTATPCADWDLAALLTHLDDSLAALTEAATIGQVGLPLAPLPIDLPDDQLVTSVAWRAGVAVGVWSGRRSGDEVGVGPDAELGEDVVASIGALELAVHGWDVARACGVDRPLPEDLAAELWPVALLAVGPADRPSRFARPVETDLPGVGARLLAYLGRPPG